MPHPVVEGQDALTLQSVSSGQLQGFVKLFKQSSTSQWAGTTVAVQPGKKKIAGATSRNA